MQHIEPDFSEAGWELYLLPFHFKAVVLALLASSLPFLGPGDGDMLQFWGFFCLVRSPPPNIVFFLTWVDMMERRQITKEKFPLSACPQIPFLVPKHKAAGQLHLSQSIVLLFLCVYHVFDAVSSGHWLLTPTEVNWEASLACLYTE